MITSMRATLRSLLIRLARTLLLLVVVLTGCQSWLIYHPRRNEDAELQLSKAKALRFITSDGEQCAWVLHRDKVVGKTLPTRVWLVFGGNGSTGLDYASLFAGPELAGDLVVLCDFPGYGRSAGKPSPASARRTVLALVPALAHELEVSMEALRPQLRVFGHSLGCAAVLMAVQEYRIESGVLIAPFTTMRDMAKKLLGWPLCEVLYHRFDNLAELRKIEDHGGAILTVFHGTADEVIPLRMSRELQTAFPKILTLHEVQDGTHNEILDTHYEQIVAAMAAL
jgi:uncharacterized protein